jgi:hypothetical protein
LDAALHKLIIAELHVSTAAKLDKSNSSTDLVLFFHDNTAEVP